MSSQTDYQHNFKKMWKDMLAAGWERVVKRNKRSVGLCPFHEEQTGSFTIEDGRYYCFGCGAEGKEEDIGANPSLLSSS